MHNDIVQLNDIFETGAFSKDLPKVTVVDAIYDDTWDVVECDTAHNLEMFWFNTYHNDEYQPDIDLQRLVDDIDEFKEIGHYTVYIGYSRDESVYDATPVKDCSYSDGRLLLFV